MNTRVRVSMAALALGTALAVAGCGTSNTAAVVDGTVISEREAQLATQQINQAFDLQQPFSTTDAVTYLIRAPFLLKYAADHGQPQSDSLARAALARVPDPSQGTLDIIKAENVAKSLDQAGAIELTTALRKAKVEVNPRYGSFDPEQAAVQRTMPDWLLRS